ncbi:hypothetical protein ABW21_db0208591 [Orbilia brochopaga]|nr:hypothetical protein ABW21_db0208591 [Drechslerella brochopaga]
MAQKKQKSKPQRSPRSGKKTQKTPKTLRSAKSEKWPGSALSRLSHRIFGSSDDSDEYADDEETLQSRRRKSSDATKKDDETTYQRDRGENVWSIGQIAGAAKDFIEENIREARQYLPLEDEYREFEHRAVDEHVEVKTEKKRVKMVCIR